MAGTSSEITRRQSRRIISKERRGGDRQIHGNMFFTGLYRRDPLHKAIRRALSFWLRPIPGQTTVDGQQQKVPS